MDYHEFIQKKKKNITISGFEVGELNSNLKDFQSYIVRKSLLHGKYAIFADCGLGKTLMQLEWSNQVFKKTNKPVLILCPLAVASQTIQEHAKFKIDCSIGRVGDNANIEVSNYEQLKNIDTNKYGGIVLDESGILKNYNGATKQLILSKFKKTSFQLACTATPSPNDHIELGNHAEFLNVMGSREMVSQFFLNDAFNKDVTQKSKWRLKKSSVKDFWQWVSSWAIMIGKPSDLGFSDDGYILPPLKIIEKVITVKEEVRDGYFLNLDGMSATDYHHKLRLSIDDRLKVVAEIANKNNEPIIVWIKQDVEGDILKKLIPEAIEVRGSDSQELKEKNLMGFANGDFRILITKKKIARFGLNYQHCALQIDASVDFSFDDYYQAIRRSYRFGQKREVRYYMIITDGMENVIDAIRRKHKQFETMQSEMCIAINNKKTGEIMSGFELVENDSYKLYNGDCIEVLKSMPDESVHYSIFSPPFSDLYMYSDDPRDLSNSSDYGQFKDHFDYLAKELHRVILTGRLVSMHCTQMSTLKSKEGYQSIVDFRGDLVRAMKKHGWDFFSEVCIFKDAMDVARRTNHPQLLHGSTKRDASQCRMAFPDYMLSFRKRGETVIPVRSEDSLSFDDWCKIAQPIWNDIVPSDTLRMPQKQNEEKHMTPTQLEPLRRLIKLYSNPKETVFSPFSGIGSEGVCSIELGRKFIGVELNTNYYNHSIRHLDGACERNLQMSLI